MFLCRNAESNDISAITNDAASSLNRQTANHISCASRCSVVEAVNQTIVGLNLERFVRQVNQLTDSIDGVSKSVADANVQSSLVQSALDHTQQQVFSLTPRITLIQDEFAQLKTYNASVFNGLTTWSGSFRAATVSTF